MTDWQPIATAPRDGTKFLGFAPANKRASNQNARYDQMRVDWKKKGSDGERFWRELPESSYTAWTPLPPPPDTCCDCGAPVRRWVFQPEEVECLNNFQRSGAMHPFTCPNNHPSPKDLLATVFGWVCPCCEYTQGWAHDFMKEYEAALHHGDLLLPPQQAETVDPDLVNARLLASKVSDTGMDYTDGKHDCFVNVQVFYKAHQRGLIKMGDGV